MPTLPDLSNPERIQAAVLELVQTGQFAGAIPLLQLLIQQLQPQGGISGLSEFLTEVASAPEQEHQWVDDPWLRFSLLLVACYRETGQLPQALETLTDTVRRAPASPSLACRLASLYWEIEDLPQALHWYGQALQINPAYLPAYEALARLANRDGLPAEALRVLETGLAIELTPAMLEELLVAHARTSPEGFRRAFIALCMQTLSPESFPFVMAIADALYQQQDWYACSYLAHHLTTVFPEHLPALDLYLLASLQQGDCAPPLTLLFARLRENPEQGGLWYRLGCALSRWQMPLSARQALLAAQELLAPNDGLLLAVTAQLAQLPEQVSRAQTVRELLRRELVDPAFRQALALQPEVALQSLGLQPDPEWEGLLAKMRF